MNRFEPNLAKFKEVDIRQLAQEIHEAAVAKGFWDVEDALDKHVAKMHCEISEAVQADRMGNMYEIERDGAKPEGVAAELADFVMMALDLIKMAGIVDRVSEYIPLAEETAEEMKIHTYHLPTIAVALHMSVCNIVSDTPADDKYICAATMITIPDAWLQAHGYDLWEIIRQKMEYNKSRPALHGRAY